MNVCLGPVADIVIPMIRRRMNQELTSRPDRGSAGSHRSSANE